MADKSDRQEPSVDGAPVKDGAAATKKARTVAGQVVQASSSGDTIPAKARAQEGSVEPDPATQHPKLEDPYARPKAFEDRFLIVQAKHGQDLYRDSGDKRASIEDRGDSLRTKSSDRPTAMDMVEVAAYRGWSKMNVKGPEDFRREAWIEGTAQGIDVKGYKPNEKDAAEAQRRSELTGYRSIERADKPGSASPDKAQDHQNERAPAAPQPPAIDYEKGIRGTITEIGKAPYRDREGASSTPFVGLKLEDGRDHKVWGVGLPDMVQKHGLGVGDKATLTDLGKRAVTVTKADEKTGEMKEVKTFRREWGAEGIEKAPEKNTAGRVAHQQEQETAGNPADKRAPKDRAAEMEERIKAPQAARDPQVKGAASKLSLIEATLKAEGVSKEDRDLTLTNARSHLANTLAAGKTVPVEKLPNVTKDQERQAKQADPRQAAQDNREHKPRERSYER